MEPLLVKEVELSKRNHNDWSVNIDRDQWIRLSDVRRYVTIGPPPTYKTVWRWATSGRKDENGNRIVLKTKKFFGVMHTTMNYLDEYATGGNE